MLSQTSPPAAHSQVAGRHPPVTRSSPAREVERDTIVGESDSLRYVLSRVERVAETNATVLLFGETGTGKELIARDIHRRSSRRDHPFVIVNCAALPALLVESELFGRERGAFTDAQVTQAGRFEIAHRGTLFLDEIGELPLESQAKLLRVLQNGQVERLGNPRPIDVDVRVIAASNRDLEEEIRQLRFRRDLFYRLNVVPITMPALRDRRSDIRLLVTYFLEHHSRALGKPVREVPAEVLAVLESYDWPGNIRELDNAIQRAVILSNGPALDVRDIWTPHVDGGASCGEPTLVEVERRHIARVLNACQWRIEGVRGAARILGLRPSTLRSRMTKLGISRGKADAAQPAAARD